jgi:hypothetical protein
VILRVERPGDFPAAGQTLRIPRFDPTRVNRPTSANLTRRAFVGAAVTAAASLSLAAAPAQDRALEPIPAGAETPPQALVELRGRYEALARDWIANDRLARTDGWVYTVEWGHFLIYFALAGDRELFLRMRDHAVRSLIINEADDPVTRGFVLWRRKPGEVRDASGTTEMLRVAKGLWLGAQSFGRPADADLAVLILRGYARHAAVDQGIWLIRNYYSLTERHYATNSFLVDYDPDFVADVAAARQDRELHDLAEKCYGVYRQAVAPCGLIYDLVQPEIKTLVGRRDVLFYSPNDIMGLHNSTTCAQVVARGLPNIAKGVLGFALARLGDLRAYYFGRTGEAVDETSATLIEFNGLTRLATLAGGAIARQQFLRWAVPRWQEYLQRVKPADAYTVAEILLTLQAVIAQKKA